ncbi:MAG TPA: hypothetical protein VF681_09490 [Abditibacteriaceae bacterium]
MTAAGEAVAVARPRVRWIVSKRYDLTWFIGSCVLTWIFFAIYRAATVGGWAPRGDSILVTYFIFTAFFDHPHIFQMFSRTHFDKEQFAKRRTLYTWGLAGFIAVGFVVVALGLEAQLIVFAAIYGTWHIIKQHMGLIRAYKIINDDLHPIDNWLDSATFYIGMFACLFNDYSDVHGPVVIYRELRAAFPSFPLPIGEWMWSTFLILLVLLGARQTWRAAEGKLINWPKLLLMTAALSTHYFVFFATATPFLVAEALETAYHDAQYHGWMMHFQRKQFPNVKRVALKWMAVALVYGAVVGTIEILGLASRGVWLWVFVPFSMLVIYHYYVDGLIWRFREDPELRKRLFAK